MKRNAKRTVNYLLGDSGIYNIFGPKTTEIASI